jgi:hypothetical protein
MLEGRVRGLPQRSSPNLFFVPWWRWLTVICPPEAPPGLARVRPSRELAVPLDGKRGSRKAVMDGLSLRHAGRFLIHRERILSPSSER